MQGVTMPAFHYKGHAVLWKKKTTAFVSLLRIKPSVPVTAMTDEKQITLAGAHRYLGKNR